MDNKRITNRQCVETIQEEPKLKYPQNISHRGSDIMQFMDYLQDFNMVKIESRPQTSIRGG